jgi:signal transduction histidine kinase
VTDGDLEIIIEDNGRGFAPDTTSTNGNGVANLNARLAAIGGRCGVESQPGHGTKVCLHVKLPAVPDNHPKTPGTAAAPSSSSA